MRLKKVRSVFRKSKFFENYAFLVMVVLVFIFGMYGLVKTPQKKSISENRTLAQYQHLTINGFLSGRFQDNFEKALSDQFLMSERIRLTYNDIVNRLPKYGIDQVVCQGRYILIGGANYRNARFDCDDNIVVLPKEMTQVRTEIARQNVAKYSRVNELANTFYYIIEEPDMFDFESGQRLTDVKAFLKENIVGKYGFSYLHFDTYDEYEKLFYKTDHHLSSNGQYLAYVDIAKLLDVDNIAVPVETVSHHELFFGTRARDARYYDSFEEFDFLRFELPKHSTMVNRKESKYGHYDEYMNHEYKYNKTYPFYSWVYGGDVGEIIFDYNQPKKDNLLVFSNSFDNPIVPVLAQHFNKTYAVDLRHYRKDIGESYVFSKYIKENKIDKVLFIMSSRYIFDKNSNQGLEL